MNTATKVTVIRLVIVPLVVIVLMTSFIKGTFFNTDLPLRYAIAGILFAIGSFTDFLDGYIARKYNQVSDLGKFLDPIADKLLVNSTLVVLIGLGSISPIIGVVLIGRDIIVDVIRMIVASQGHVIAAGKGGKYKTVFQMLGITLVLFGNLPFQTFSTPIPIDDLLLIIAVFFSVLSGIQYYTLNKQYLFIQEPVKEFTSNLFTQDEMEVLQSQVVEEVEIDLIAEPEVVTVKMVDEDVEIEAYGEFDELNEFEDEEDLVI